MDSPALMLDAGGEPELGLELGDMLDLISPHNRSRSLDAGTGLSPALLGGEQGSIASPAPPPPMSALDLSHGRPQLLPSPPRDVIAAAQHVVQLAPLAPPPQCLPTSMPASAVAMEAAHQMGYGQARMDAAGYAVNIGAPHMPPGPYFQPPPVQPTCQAACQALVGPVWRLGLVLVIVSDC